ncbi:hypothetical protein MKZ38_004676 [Zalerion maritima]|uniref:Uncharacterized protein n=1 Tax=Zalerion maritima TaxID=339359 RepID=A0AAD5RMC4_9PEZI|nr:hypothetical protein MKZ38_004676 [Zalerion maritima]
MPRLALASAKYIAVAFFIVLLLWFHTGQFSSLEDGSGSDKSPSPLAPGGFENGDLTTAGATPKTRPEVEIVVASTKKDDTSWFARFLPGWERNIYVVDDRNALLQVPKNLGREAMVFLTYVIDRYETLPKYTIFHHASRMAWHNDNPDYDSLFLLQRFNFTYLGEQGYVNLRCVWTLGCPAEIHPLEDAGLLEFEEVSRTARKDYAGAFRELFPGQEVPSEVGVPCCSQFGVSRLSIMKRPREDYIRYRDWLLNTKLDDGVSGRVLEYSWHIIFGKNATHCPDAEECYCRVYGLCDMKGPCDETGCQGWYTLPQFANLPVGWPRMGWDGEDRGWKGEI